MRVITLCATIMFLLLSTTQLRSESVLTTLTFSQRDSVWTENFRVFTGGVETESKGTVRFRYAGGPESIPPFEQIEAIRRGVVDVVMLPAAYFVPQLPEADAMKLSPFMPWEERMNGVFEFYDNLMRDRLGVHYLGRLTAGVKYHFYLKRKMKRGDFHGLKIRVTPIYEPFVRALEGTPVTMAAGEIYTALQRGVVDGLGWPAIGFEDLGWDEVVKYIVEPGFYQTDVCVLVNLKSWNRMDEKTKGLLNKAIEQAERASQGLSADIALKERASLMGKGIKVIAFEGKKAEAYLGLAYQSAWNRILAKCPENGPRLKKLMESR